ncbi:unnamed protein product [Pieris brassicae]|uniref:Uncharacterized protein n=1 Tax=Pieris brassicae TaxID=7116 RepID=A0A9P0TD55_PIEBR|nr:unnamed protein product [Pieris brassicae]
MRKKELLIRLVVSPQKRQEASSQGYVGAKGYHLFWKLVLQETSVSQPPWSHLMCDRSLHLVGSKSSYSLFSISQVLESNIPLTSQHSGRC